MPIISAKEREIFKPQGTYTATEACYWRHETTCYFSHYCNSKESLKKRANP